MGLPIIGILGKATEFVLKQAGVLGKGKGTPTAAAGLAAGVVSSIAGGDDVFMALHTLLELVQQGIGPAVTVISVLVGLFTVGRKSGAKGAEK